MDKEKEDLTETVDRTYIAYSLPLPPPPETLDSCRVLGNLAELAHRLLISALQTRELRDMPFKTKKYILRDVLVGSMKNEDIYELVRRLCYHPELATSLDMSKLPEGIVLCRPIAKLIRVLRDRSNSLNPPSSSTPVDSCTRRCPSRNGHLLDKRSGGCSKRSE